MTNEPVDLMVISPHPSDPDFGIGGTVLQMTRQGKRVVYVICTNGDKGSSDPDLKPEVLAATRKREQLAAAELLGVKEVIFLPHRDQELEDEPVFRKEVVKLLLTYRPHTVATCDPTFPVYISNRDHRVCGRVVLDAVWPTLLAPNTYRELLAEGLKLHKVQEVLIWQAAQTNYKRDISDVFDIKMTACRIHQSQIGPQGNQEFDPMLIEFAKQHAKGESYEYGEAFNRIEVLQRL